MKAKVYGVEKDGVINRERETSYKASVYDHLRTAYEAIYRSLEDETRSIELLQRACREWETVNTENLKRATKQSNHYAPGKQEKAIDVVKRALRLQRKAATIRVYHAIGPDAFQWLVKENLEVAEHKEILGGQAPSPEASHYRFLKKIFDAKSYAKGAFGPISGVLGILFAGHPNLLIEISAILHGICYVRDTNSRNYKNAEYFRKLLERALADLYNHFSPQGLFEEADYDNVNENLRRALKPQQRWFAVRPASEIETANTAASLKLLGPWGAVTIPTNGLGENFRTYQIPEFQNPEKTPFFEIPYVRRRVASVMDLGFIQKLLKNESIRIKNMSDQILVPVLAGDQGQPSRAWAPVPDLPESAIIQIIEDKLEFASLRQGLTTFAFEVDVDHQLVRADATDSTSGFLELDIPATARVVTIYGRVQLDTGGSSQVPLATVLPQLIDLDSGETWASDNVLENGRRFRVEIQPNNDNNTLRLTAKCESPTSGLLQESRSRHERQGKVSSIFDGIVGLGRADLSAYVVLVGLYMTAVFSVNFEITRSFKATNVILLAFYLPVSLFIIISFILSAWAKAILPARNKLRSGFVWKMIVFSVIIALSQFFVSARIRASKAEKEIDKSAYDLAAERRKINELKEVAVRSFEEYAFDSGGPSDDGIDLETERIDVEEKVRVLQQKLSPLYLPNAWPYHGTINNEFGFRRNPFGGRTYEFHPGMDIDGERGDPVIAPANGTVVTARYKGGYGNMVEIDHGSGLTTRYGHLSKIEAEEGQNIRGGATLGYIGSTGRSTGPHLHYEIRFDDHPINPRHFLPPGDDPNPNLSAE